MFICYMIDPQKQLNLKNNEIISQLFLSMQLFFFFFFGLVTNIYMYNPTPFFLSINNSWQPEKEELQLFF